MIDMREADSDYEGTVVLVTGCSGANFSFCKET
jgi:hypothetical protein